MPHVLARLLDAIDLAVIATDLQGNVTYWSQGATALYGWSSQECLGKPMVEITPAFDSAHGAERIMGLIRSGQSWRGVFATRRRDGSSFDARVTLSPLRDDTGGLTGIIGVSEDVTALGEQERQLADRTERLELALQSGHMGTWRWDIATGAVFWDDTLEALFGLERGTFDGTMDTYSRLMHPDDRSETLATIQRSIASGADHEVEHRFFGPDGTVRWLAGNGRVVMDADGVATGMIGVAADVTARKAAEAERESLLAAERHAHAAAEAARDRLAFLGRAGVVLTETLDYEVTLRRLADLVVEQLADWCVIDLVDDEIGTVRRAVVATSVQGVGDLTDAMTRLRPASVDSAGEVTRAIRSGQSALHPHVTDEMLQAWARDTAHLDVMRAIGIASMIIVPLKARGRRIGALSMSSTRGGRVYGDEDLILLTELARRAAVAIENARLFAESAAVVATLQRSLLPPELPGAAGLEIAARYRPSRRSLEVGGDFYDMFPVGSDRWCLVIGDVMGKGAEAASLTGAVRWTVRALAAREHDPHSIVCILNETLLTERTHNRFCTIVVAIASVETGVVRLTLANGGHPPPLLRRADGTIERGSEGGMLVGILPDIEVATDLIELLPGDTMVLYTDGVTEARAGNQFFGEPRLVDVIAALPNQSAAASATAIENAVIGYQDNAVRDDLALLLVRAPVGATEAAATQAVSLLSR